MKILLAIDRSEPAIRARDLVASLRLAPDTRVRVISVVPEMGVAYGGEAETHLARFVEEAAVPLREAGATVETGVMVGRPAAVILAEAAGADLLVLGSHARAPVAELVLGSTSAEVVEGAAGPVLVARHPRVSGLLVADDGSPAADRAAAFVAESGLFAGLPAGVVSVAQSSSDRRAESAAATESHKESPEKLGARRADLLRGSELKDVSAHAPQGDPAAEIVERAKAGGFDLIVMGVHGRHGLRERILGSVARSVLHRSHCSILTAPPR